MPLYLKDKKAIFHMHVPKTGGTALHAFFSKNKFECLYRDPPLLLPASRYRHCLSQHMHASQISAILRAKRFDFLFMTVRDPLTRTISAYKMRSRKGVQLAPIDIWFGKVMELYRRSEFAHGNLIRPQAHFWMPGCVVFRFEEGYEQTLFDRMELATGLKLKHRTLEEVNVNRKEALDPASIERLTPLVAEFYREDYEKFGY